MPSDRITSVLRAFQTRSTPIRATGATPPTQALLLARVVMLLQEPLVVLCPTEDHAIDLGSDIESLSLAMDGSSPRIYTFPGWEQSPYSSAHPSIRTRLTRLDVLLDLFETKKEKCEPFVLLTTPSALSQLTIPKEVFAQNTLYLRPGQDIGSRETLCLRWLEAGYLRVDPVEDPGTFSIRGEILDIFPPHLNQPIRIELFDTQIERIRFFDPVTQKTTGGDWPSASPIIVPPAREVLVNQSTAVRLKENIKACSDDLGISRAVRDPVFASIQPGVYSERADYWGPFAYAAPGHLMDYLPPSTSFAWVDELTCLESISSFLEEEKARAEKRTEKALIVPDVSSLFVWSETVLQEIRSKTRLFLDRLSGVDSEAQFHFEIQPNDDLAKGSKPSLGELESHFRSWLQEGFRISVFANTDSQLERIRFLLEERNLPCVKAPSSVVPKSIALWAKEISCGFRWPTEGLIVLTDSEILGQKHARKAQPTRIAESGSAAKEWSGLNALSDLAAGDAIVHVDHGIGRYHGLVRLDLGGAPGDFLQLEYANKDRLYLPVYRLNVIQKYVGAGESVTLDRLGSAQFTKTKEKVKEAVKSLAVDLVQLYAERQIRPGLRFSPRDSLLREFEAKFNFSETPDQLRSIDDILSDLASGKVMDRLVCGDVGYGKTEVAMRAAFRAVTEGKQVAVLVPTTVLAFQHEQSFKQRFQEYPIRIESISRFKSPKSQKEVLDALASGRVDIIIGTHRLLSKDVRFKDLGLIVIDEEHRFGVEHKERLKTLRVNTHVLTLTATPIPRTLHMALSGLREISLINTPPVDRLPIRTFVSRFDEEIIHRALTTELNRDGQAFFLHNRVQDIHEFASTINELVPRAKIGVAHGQMGEGELEKIMLAFYQKKINVLVCTSIIESGLDIPSANTIIIDRADTLGLAQLYQIRGRVGRGQERAYAYLLLPKEGSVTEEAKRRLEIIQRFVELGSGFSVANHDLELRGGGDLLGPQQSGHIAAVGFDLYTELLEEAIRELQGKPLAPEQRRREPEIKLPFPAFLAEDYVPDIHQRLSLYRRFSAASTDKEIEQLEEELLDRFGPIPECATNLLWLIRIKQLLKGAGIDALTVGPEKISLIPGPESLLDPVRGIALVAAQPKKYQLTPDSRLIATLTAVSMRDLFFGLESLLQQLT